MRSLFALVMLQRFTAENPVFRRAHHPLLAVVIMNRLADGIVRHYVEDQVLTAVVNELMRFPWFEDKGVTRFDRSRSVLMPHPALAGNHMVKLPLRAV